MHETERFFKEQLLPLVDAGAAVIQLVSHEWERVEGLLMSVAKQQKRSLLRWTVPFGTMVFKPDRDTFEPVGGDTENDVKLALRDFLKREEPCIYLIADPPRFHADRNEDPIDLALLRECARVAPDAKKTLVLLTPVAALPPELEKAIPQLHLPLPDKWVLNVVAKQVADQFKLDASTFEENDDLLQAASGLTQMEARLAFAQAAATRKRLTASEVDLVIAEKERLIRRSGVLEYFHPKSGLNDVGGLDNLIAWLQKRQRGFSGEADRFRVERPRGILLLGVQGCGKSLMAKTVASEWRFPLLRFDLGRAFGSLVGSSEGNMRSALSVAEAIAPCVLWIDEIEKGFSGVASSNQTDGGTAARVFGTFLTWMQEKSAPVFVVATANNVEALPPELLRKGRFDEIFFVDLPGTAARERIFRIHLKRRERDPDELGLEMPRLAELTQGYSGAEIEEAVKEALYTAFADSKRDLAQSDLEAAIEQTFPLSRTMGPVIEGLRRWAGAGRVRPASSETDVAPVGTGSGKAPAKEIPLLRQEKQRNPFVLPGDDEVR